MPCQRRPEYEFVLGNFHFFLGHETKIMGVLNVTPDSFSDGGLFLRPEKAIAQALKMEREGAHILDVGAESSRPGSRPVSAREEIKRLKPVLQGLSKKIIIPISVDTTKYDVASMAMDNGAVLVNDITALKGNRKLAKLIARQKAGVVLMHMRGTPQNMQTKTQYENVMSQLTAELKKSVNFALDAGIARSHVVVDPGFGFAKTPTQNLEILASLDKLALLKLPVLAGLSKKSFIGHVLGSKVGERLTGSLAGAAIAIQNGAHILRVHDVLPHRELAAVVDGTLDFMRN